MTRPGMECTVVVKPLIVRSGVAMDTPELGLIPRGALIKVLREEISSGARRVEIEAASPPLADETDAAAAPALKGWVTALKPDGHILLGQDQGYAATKERYEHAYWKAQVGRSLAQEIARRRQSALRTKELRLQQQLRELAATASISPNTIRRVAREQATADNRAICAVNSVQLEERLEDEAAGVIQDMGLMLLGRAQSREPVVDSPAPRSPPDRVVDEALEDEAAGVIQDMGLMLLGRAQSREPVVE